MTAIVRSSKIETDFNFKIKKTRAIVSQMKFSSKIALKTNLIKSPLCTTPIHNIIYYTYFENMQKLIQYHKSSIFLQENEQQINFYLHFYGVLHTKEEKKFTTVNVE